MPVKPTSRYRGLPVHVAPDAAGAHHATIPARAVPEADPDATPYFHTVVAGESLELLAHRYLGSSEAWWRIADANPNLLPFEPPPGTPLAIPTTASAGRIERTRTF